MYDNQKQIDDINEQIKSICSGLEIGPYGIYGNKVINVGIKVPIKGNSEVIRKLEEIGFKKLYRERLKGGFDTGYASSRYKGYSMYQNMIMDLRGEENER